MASRPTPTKPERPSPARRPRGPHLAAGLVLLALLLGPLLGPRSTARADGAEALTDQATLETRQPVVQWSVAGAVAWLTADERQIVRAGDRVRTGPDASARLVYFEGTVIEIAPGTGLRVEQLTTTASGGIVSRLLQTAGVTVSRVVHLVDPAASFEVETPAAVVFVRGTTPRVAVDPDDTTHVWNLPDGTASRVFVRGKDAAQTEVVLLEGEETDVAPGQPPAPPRPSRPAPAPTPVVRTIGLPVVPPATSPPGGSPNPCPRPGGVCNPPPTVDLCHIRPSLCGPTSPGTITPPPSDPGPPAPPPSATPRPPSPTPTPTLNPDPCQRPGVVCDPLPPSDPCRLRPSRCGSGDPPPATPTPTRTAPPPSGDTGGGRPVPPSPTLVIPQSPGGDTGGRPVPSLPHPPTGDGGSRGAPTTPYLPIDDLGAIRRLPTLIVSQPPPAAQPPSSGPIVR